MALGLCAPLAAQTSSASSEAPEASASVAAAGVLDGAAVAKSLECMSSSVLPALEGVSDGASAEQAAAKLMEAAPQVRLLAHVLLEDLSREEQEAVLPQLAPRMKELLAQLDSCCRLSAELLSHKPSAYGSEALARALTGLIDIFMCDLDAEGRGRTDPADVPLALAEADAQVSALNALLASLERLQELEAVERDLPAIRRQVEELRNLQRRLADSSRWSKTLLFLVMQRTRARGADAIADLGRCTARLLGLDPPCYGSAELQQILGTLVNHSDANPAAAAP